jgi:hypothetical protein
MEAPMRLVAEELIRAGFESIRTMNWPISGTIRHYCMLFRKPKALAEAAPANLSPLPACHCRRSASTFLLPGRL